VKLRDVGVQTAEEMPPVGAFVLVEKTMTIGAERLEVGRRVIGGVPIAMVDIELTKILRLEAAAFALVSELATVINADAPAISLSSHAHFGPSQFTLSRRATPSSRVRSRTISNQNLDRPTNGAGCSARVAINCGKFVVDTTNFSFRGGQERRPIKEGAAGTAPVSDPRPLTKGTDRSDARESTSQLSSSQPSPRSPRPAPGRPAEPTSTPDAGTSCT
jgi:hypothetical protein